MNNRLRDGHIGVRIGLAALILIAAGLMATRGALAQQSTVTDDNLDEAVASAKTPADHEAIASYYDREAAEDEAKAKLHRAVEGNYVKFHIKPPDMANHCKELAKSFDRAAQMDKDLAAEHRAMAKKLEAKSAP